MTNTVSMSKSETSSSLSHLPATSPTYLPRKLLMRSCRAEMTFINQSGFMVRDYESASSSFTYYHPGALEFFGPNVDTVRGSLTATDGLTDNPGFEC